MKEIKIDENKYRIIGLDKSDIANIPDCVDITKATIAIKKNGVMKIQVPINIISRLGTFLFPDNPIDYDKTKDKIGIIIEG